MGHQGGAIPPLAHATADLKAHHPAANAVRHHLCRLFNKHCLCAGHVDISLRHKYRNVCDKRRSFRDERRSCSHDGYSCSHDGHSSRDDGRSCSHDDRHVRDHGRSFCDDEHKVRNDPYKISGDLVDRLKIYNEMSLGNADL